MELISPQQLAAFVSGHCRRNNGYPELTHGASAFDADEWKGIRRGLKLSPRELQIVQRIFDDKLESAIAAELGISFHTARTELRRLRQKLKTANRMMLVLKIVEEFLRQTAFDKTALHPICPEYSNGHCPLKSDVSKKLRPLPQARAAA
jgi:DNA-binding NarL/FixJ family response regulator